MKYTENTGTKRTQRDYTLGFKLAIVEQVEKGDFTYKEAQKALWHSRSKYCSRLVKKTW